jgi:serine/threonine protein kinase/WD40 repeat protein
VTLTTGDRLGQYHIAAQIGAGGMGQVYRALDTNLGRQVAIKILLEAFSHDPDRSARFEREAKMLAALNHPNIAQIYGFEKADGVCALVMELVEGPTLAERVAQGLLRLDEVRAIARQIAEALEAAHEQGIIHRDLKPANIKLRPNGTVKVLDFGLAKFLDQTPAARVDMSASPTITSPAMITGAGALLGTAAYMSPEQARGQPVDRRTDIWAFGCLLYEMLSGRSPFDARTTSDAIAGILTAEPDWTKLPASTPAGVRRLLRRCLEKDPRRRFHDAADVRIELEDALDVPVSTAMPRRTPLWKAAVAGALCAAGGALTIWVLVRSQPSAAPGDVVTLQVPAPWGATLTPAEALSPDGRQLALVVQSNGVSKLWVHRIASATAIPLEGTEGAGNVFWSPDSRSLAFFTPGKLKRVASDGTSPVTEICDVAIARGGAWSRRDEILFAAVDGPLSLVPAVGGRPRPVTALDTSRGDVAHIRPQFLPDGGHFIFAALGRTRELRVASLDAVTSGRSISDDAPALYSSGHLLFVRGGRLLAQPFDSRSLRTTGAAFGIVERVERVNPGQTPISVSENGALSYVSYMPVPSRLTWFDRTGAVVGTIDDVGDWGYLALSLDETHLAASKRDATSSRESLWVFDLTRGAMATRITSARQDSSLLRWSPDGKQIIYNSQGESPFNVLARTRSDDSGAEEIVLRPPVGNWLNDWSRDGAFIVYALDSAATSGDLWILPLTGDRTPKAFLQTRSYEAGGAFAPDSKAMAYVSDASGRLELYVRDFPSGDRPVRISVNGGSNPMWRADGRELYFVTPDQWMMAATFRFGGDEPPAIRKLFSFPVPQAATGRWHQYAVTADGSRFLAIVPEGQLPPRSATVVMNWRNLVTRR